MGADVVLASQITAVVVYRRGARVTRSAELARGAGYPARVRFDNLPLCLDDGTVRARIEVLSDGGAAPIASDLRVVLAVPERDDKLEPAEDEALAAVRREAESVAAVLATMEREIAELAALDIVPRHKRGKNEPPVDSPTDGRLALIDVRETRRRELQQELEATRRALRRVHKRKSELEDKHRRTSSARRAREHELRKALWVHLRDGASERVRLHIDYLVPGASWAPAYTARMEHDMGALSLAMRALVAQDTAEDWSDVALMLSTADAERWSELVELQSLRIGRRIDVPPRRGWRPAPLGAEELFADYDRLFENRAEPTPLQEEEPAPMDMIAPLSSSELARAPAGAVAMPAAAAQEIMLPVSARGKGAGLFNFLSDVADAPAQLLQAQLFKRQIDAREEQSEEPTARALLDYGKLRLAAPNREGRGRLMLAEERTLYLELLVHERRVTVVDVMDEIGDAFARAERVDADMLPPRHRLAWSDDYDYAYVCEARVDVPSDGAFHSIPVATREGKAKLAFVTVPRESTDVFRLARLKNPLASPLLSGPIDVYVDDEFLVTSQVDFTAPGGELSLGLGVEQGIKVARNTRFREQSAGLMGGSLLLEHHIAIDIENHCARAVDIEVRERVPVLV
ncbi:MAG TPA: DUF4139 domain-containing protein, partial [Polyangiaceae bacterium]|nr:DUF4139 domain-containing protein [Polyangiaceae bacterium]